jgi:hypothetical protein
LISIGYRHRGGAEILFASMPAHDEIFAGNRPIGRIVVAVGAGVNGTHIANQ